MHIEKQEGPTMLRSPLFLIGTAIGTTLALTQPASAEPKTYDLDGFSTLKASQAINVIYTQSEVFSVTADVENDEFDELIVEKRGDALTLERPKRRGGWLRNNSRPEITVYVAAPTLSAIQISSSAQFTGDTITASNLKLAASSSGDIELAGVSAGQLETRASSSGTIELTGTCTSLAAKVSSSGRVSADGLTCDTADIDASSSGRIGMAVNGGPVDLDLSSSSDADLSGQCSLIAISASSSAQVDARSLTCASLDARASSGSDIVISITDSVEARASSGADIDIYGSPADVDERTSSGGDVDIHSAL
jgi:hypothetical protein